MLCQPGRLQQLPPFPFFFPKKSVLSVGYRSYHYQQEEQFTRSVPAKLISSCTCSRVDKLVILKHGFSASDSECIWAGDRCATSGIDEAAFFYHSVCVLLSIPAISSR